MSKNLGRVMGTVLLVLSLCLVTLPTVHASGTSNSLGTDAGIGFSSDSTTPSSSSSSGRDTLPSTGGGTTGGKLPQTGELTTPFILLLVGWAVVILSVTVYLLIKKKNEKETEEYE
ncbi:LPXTG cell wall anchor domain-containing protein [Enterococcus sp. LJL90]